jgi:hypothetical protein
MAMLRVSGASWVVSLIFACWLFSGAARGELRPIPVDMGQWSSATTRTFESPSREFSLSIMQDVKAFGHGPAKYSSYRNGHGEWTIDLPFTLCEVAVLDSGSIFGTAEAYAPGQENEPDRIRSSYLHVVLLDEHGGVMMDEKHSQRPHHILANPPMRREPYVRGLFVDGGDTKALVWVLAYERYERTSQIWSYDLTAGKRVQSLDLSEIDGQEGSRISLCEVRPLRGVDCVAFSGIAHGKPSRQTAVFGVVDSDANLVWRYPALPQAPDPAPTGLQEQPPIGGQQLTCNDFGVHVLDEAGVFFISNQLEKTKLIFSLVKDGDKGWNVQQRP